MCLYLNTPVIYFQMYTVWYFPCICVLLIFGRDFIFKCAACCLFIWTKKKMLLIQIALAIRCEIYPFMTTPACLVMVFLLSTRHFMPRWAPSHTEGTSIRDREIRSYSGIWDPRKMSVFVQPIGIVILFELFSIHTKGNF